MPITVRYGDNSILEAAQGVGRTRALQQQRAYDQQEIASVRNYYAIQDQQQIESSRITLDKLKMQQQGRMAGSSTPRANYAQGIGMTGALNQMRPLANRLGISSEDQARLTLADELGDTKTIHDILSPDQGDPDLQNKTSYVTNLAATNNMSEGETQGLLTLHNTPGVTMSQLQTATRAAINRSAEQSGVISPQYKNILQVRDIDSQLRQLRSRAAKQSEGIQDQGYSAEGAPTQFNPEITEPKSGVGGNMYETYIGTDTVTGGDPEGMRVYTDYHRVKAEIRKLEQQKQTLLNGGTPSETEGGQSEDVQSLSTQELIQSLLTGG